LISSTSGFSRSTVRLTSGYRRTSLSRVRTFCEARISRSSQSVWRLPRTRTKNAKAHVVHLSEQSMAMLRRLDRRGPYVFSPVGNKPFQTFSKAKRLLDQLSGVTGWRLHDLRRTCVSGMAQLGVSPHVADKILNHQSGAISGVAAVYQRHEFIAERRTALDLWGTHVSELVKGISPELRIDLKIVA